MSTATAERTLAFDLPEELVAREPVEATGRRRDEVRMLVARRSSDLLVDALAADLPTFLEAGDVLVVNDSATLAAAVPTCDGLVLHVSTELPGRFWVVELRRPCGKGTLPYTGAAAGPVELPGGARAELLAPFPAGTRTPARLWVAALDLPSPLDRYLGRFGRPIRYGCVDSAWPLADYQTVFAGNPGSAEMASAARPFTPELVAALRDRGVVVAPITLHTGVSSPEVGEPPYPERFDVPAATADAVNAARAGGRRVVAVGTTSVRALETVADAGGRVHPGRGWTEHVVTPPAGVRAVDGILTGWHEPQASHLDLLEAVAGRDLLERSYAHALRTGYRWHEFGDVHLILR
ncbi:MAG TPA: S-adenosylmethionine:tRNA ribosyltransferase-isomerase [Acidimicrobiales bacterium]|nr:S-adenosylmethionine:tRNA ribosyltransferase-isomerase [Acidimicrobiales bacterium]